MSSPRLFIGGLKRNVEKEEMIEEFKEFGEIVDLWIAYDPPGFAFIEFGTPDCAKAALECKHKTMCFDCEIRVEYTKKKNEAERDAADKNSSEIKPRLFIGNIIQPVEKEDMKAVYEVFGNITDIWIAHNPPGFAFVEFDTMDVANKAVEETDGKELFGGTVKVQITKGRREGRRNRVNENRDRAPPRRQSPYPPADPYGRRRPAPYARDPYARDPYARDAYARDPYYADSYARAPYPRDPYYADTYARDPYYARDAYARRPAAPAAADYPAYAQVAPPAHPAQYY